MARSQDLACNRFVGCGLYLSNSKFKYFFLYDTTDGIVMILSYLKSVRWANTFAVAEITLLISSSVFLFGIWVIGAILFHNRQVPAFNVPNIWSWSCNHEDSSDDVVNFNQICLTQVLHQTPYSDCRIGHLYVQLSR